MVGQVSDGLAGVCVWGGRRVGGGVCPCVFGEGVDWGGGCASVRDGWVGPCVRVWGGWVDPYVRVCVAVG